MHYKIALFGRLLALEDYLHLKIAFIWRLLSSENCFHLKIALIWKLLSSENFLHFQQSECYNHQVWKYGSSWWCWHWRFLADTFVWKTHISRIDALRLDKWHLCQEVNFHREYFSSFAFRHQLPPSASMMNPGSSEGPGSRNHPHPHHPHHPRATSGTLYYSFFATKKKNNWQTALSPHSLETNSSLSMSNLTRA